MTTTYEFEGLRITEDMQDMIIEAVEEVTSDCRKKKELEQNTTRSDNVEAIRLAVEVVSLMNRYGYKLDDSKLMEVIKLCERVAVK